jgi:outer membrane protein TolC
MAKKHNVTLGSFANRLSPLLILAVYIGFAACGGSRSHAKRIEDQSAKDKELNLVAVSKPTQEQIADAAFSSPDTTSDENAADSAKALAMVDSINAMISAIESLPNFASQLDRTDSALYYEPFSEAQITATIQRPLTLDDFISIALSKNIALHLAEGELAKAEVVLSGSYGKFFPILTLQGAQEEAMQKRPFNSLDSLASADPTRLYFSNSFLTGKIEQALPTGALLNFAGDLRRDLNSPDRFGAPPTRTQNLAYSISLTQPLLRGAGATIARSAINLARYDRQIKEKQFADMKLFTIYAVKRAFYLALEQRELVKVSQLAIRRDSSLVRASESMMLAKRATRRDVLSAQIRLADDRATLIKNQSEYELALDALKEVAGLPLEAPIELAETELRFSPVSLDEKALVRRAVDNNPSLHSAETAITRARLSLKVARNALRPQLDLVVSHNGQFDTDRDRNKNLWAAGLRASLNLSYPFLNREAAAKAENTEIELAQQQERLVNLQRQVALGIRRIVRIVRKTAEELNALQATIDAAEEKVDFASTMFNLGRASNLDITDAQEALLKAQTQYVRELVDYHIQLALLESLTGQPVAQ